MYLYIDISIDISVTYMTITTLLILINIAIPLDDGTVEEAIWFAVPAKHGRLVKRVNPVRLLPSTSNSGFIPTPLT